MLAEAVTLERQNQLAEMQGSAGYEPQLGAACITLVQVWDPLAWHHRVCLSAAPSGSPGGRSGPRSTVRSEGASIQGGGAPYLMRGSTQWTNKTMWRKSTSR